MNPARLRAYLLLLTVVVIWGVAPSVIKFALGELPPFLFLSYRFLITTVVVFPFFYGSKNKGLTLANLPLIILISVLGSTLNLGLLFYGSNLTTSLDQSLISATSPILVVIAGVWFFKEHLTKREKIGIAITFLGTLIVTLQSFFERGGVAAPSVVGNIIIFLSDVAFTAYLLISKKALRLGISPITITFMMFFVGLLTCLPLALTEISLSEIPMKIMTIKPLTHLSVIYMSLVSGALGYTLYQKAQKTIEASEAAVFTYLTPLITAPVGVLWLHEELTVPFIIGSIVIACGVILAEWKKK